MMDHGFRSMRFIQAKSTFGLPGCSSTSMAPVESLTKSVFFQVLPPSVVLNTPRVLFGLKMSPYIAAQATSGLDG